MQGEAEQKQNGTYFIYCAYSAPCFDFVLSYSRNTEYRDLLKRELGAIGLYISIYSICGIPSGI